MAESRTATGRRVDELIIHIEAITGISDESLLIFKEVKEIKIRYKQQKDEIQAKIDELKP